MIQSMTGFGAGERGAFKVEIRSVNHRFIDMSFKLPQNLSRHEMPMRNILRERFSRGKLDVMVSITEEERGRIAVNMGIAKELYSALSSVKEALSLPGEIGAGDIVELRELFLSKEVEYKTEEFYDAFNDAVDKLYRMRAEEGDGIAKDMLMRLGHLEQMKDSIALVCSGIAVSCRERLIERLNALFGEAGYDEDRIIQEAAIIAERADVSEEIMRIGLHIGQARKILSDGDAIGRKIEFMLQELNREVNTIASKANDYRVSSTAVEMKSELEKIREQAQNIQ